jgi:hypothetical protein
MSEEKQTIAALIESNDILQEEVSRLRNSNRILRTVHRALRAANESLRAQVELAEFNDNTFKSFCQGDFDVTVPNPSDDGLLEPGS